MELALSTPVSLCSSKIHHLEVVRTRRRTGADNRRNHSGKHKINACSSSRSPTSGAGCCGSPRPAPDAPRRSPPPATTNSSSACAPTSWARSATSASSAWTRTSQWSSPATRPPEPSHSRRRRAGLLQSWGRSRCHPIVQQTPRLYVAPPFVDGRGWSGLSGAYGFREPQGGPVSDRPALRRSLLTACTTPRRRTPGRPAPAALHGLKRWPVPSHRPVPRAGRALVSGK